MCVCVCVCVCLCSCVRVCVCERKRDELVDLNDAIFVPSSFGRPAGGPEQCYNCPFQTWKSS